MVLLKGFPCFHDFSHGVSHPYIAIHSIEWLLHLYFTGSGLPNDPIENSNFPSSTTVFIVAAVVVLLIIVVAVVGAALFFRKCIGKASERYVFK